MANEEGGKMRQEEEEEKERLKWKGARERGRKEVRRQEEGFPSKGKTLISLETFSLLIFLLSLAVIIIT